MKSHLTDLQMSSVITKTRKIYLLSYNACLSDICNDINVKIIRNIVVYKLNDKNNASL